MENINEKTVGKYAVGDKVIYNSTPGRGRLTVGKEYIIRAILPDVDGTLFEIVCDDGRAVQRWASRFLDNKNGNKVYAVEDFGAFLRKGQVYEVVKETQEYITVKINEDTNKVYKKFRFTKVQAEVPYKAPEKPKAQFVETNKGHVMTGDASYSIFFKNGGESKWLNDACHARLIGGVDVIGAYTWIKSDRELGAGYKGFVEWMVFNSAWKDCFVKNQTLEEMMEGGVELDITKPTSVLFTACVMLRMYHEFLQFKETWDKLIELGFSENVAFLCAHLFRRGAISKESDAHGVITNSSEIKDVVKSFKGGGFAQVSHPFNTAEGNQFGSRFASRGIASQTGDYSKVFLNIPNKFKKLEMAWGRDTKFVCPETSLIPVAIRFTEEFVK